MSEPTEDVTGEEEVTVANIQRLESGYFDHMQSLRERIPVDDYLVTPETGRYALIAMVAITLGLLALFPVTMFYQYSYLVVVLYLVAFVVFGRVFYQRVMVVNEASEEWRD